MKYEIEGGNLPVVICYPEEGQTLCTECGSMSWMSPNMEMQTNTGGGLKKALGCLFAGESIFLNEYSPRGGSGMIAFAASFPGTIIPFAVAPGNGIIVQKRGFLAMVIQSMPVINTAQVLSGYIYDADGNEIKDGISNM